MTWGPNRLRIELETEGEGTRLELSEVLDDLGKAARNGAGWHECLNRLGAIIVGARPDRWGVRWHEVYPRYAEVFGSDATRLPAPDGWADDVPKDPYAPRFPHHPDSPDKPCPSGLHTDQKGSDS